MNTIVKQRIEQIKSGQVPSGYKRTKLGIVPKEWSEVRFNELFERVSRKNSENNKNVLTISAQHGLINQKNFFNKQIASEDKSNYYLLHKGEFAYNKSYSNGYPFGAIKALEYYEKGIVSPLYICFSRTEKNKQSKYYIQYFEGGLLNREIKAIAQEGARNHGLLNIAIDDFFNMHLTLPTLPEQEKIAKILETQDKIIELYQRKIEGLHKLKKIYLSKMFPQKGKNVPEWRFPQFSDAWEQRKLGEVADKVTEKNIGLQYIETLTNSAEYGIISQRDFFEHDISKIDSLGGYYIVQNEDFVYNPRISTAAPVGPINRNKLGRNGVMSPLYTVFRPHDIDNTFLEHFFKSKYWHAYMNFNGDSGARSDRFSIKDGLFFEMPIPLPHIEEQRKVGKYLTALDHLITLHQRKLEEMKKYKKSLMQLLLTGIVRVNL